MKQNEEMKTASPNEAKSPTNCGAPISISSLAKRLHSFISPNGATSFKNPAFVYRTKAGFLLERVMGIEPTYPAWKAGILPLNYTRK